MAQLTNTNTVVPDTHINYLPETEDLSFSQKADSFEIAQSPSLQTHASEQIGTALEWIREDWVRFEENRNALSMLTGDGKISDTYEYYTNEISRIHEQLIEGSIQPATALFSLNNSLQALNQQLSDDINWTAENGQAWADVAKQVRDTSVGAFASTMTALTRNPATGGQAGVYYGMGLDAISNLTNSIIGGTGLDTSVGNYLKQRVNDAFMAFTASYGEAIYQGVGVATTRLGFNPVSVGALAAGISGSFQVGTNMIRHSINIATDPQYSTAEERFEAIQSAFKQELLSAGINIGISTLSVKLQSSTSITPTNNTISPSNPGSLVRTPNNISLLSPRIHPTRPTPITTNSSTTNNNALAPDGLRTTPGRNGTFTNATGDIITSNSQGEITQVSLRTTTGDMTPSGRYLPQHDAVMTQTSEWGS